MRLFAWLWRPKKRHKKPPEPAAAKKPRRTQSVTIVQIDMGNVGSRKAPTNWDVLRQAIARDCAGVFPYKRYAYRRVERNQQDGRDFLERATFSWESAGYRFSPNVVRGKDIDMSLAADLTLWLDELLEKNDEVHVRLILASGDGDFAPFIKNKRQVYKNRLHLELIVYTWIASLSPALNELAGPLNVRYLDDLNGYEREE